MGEHTPSSKLDIKISFICTGTQLAPLRIDVDTNDSKAKICK